MTLTVPAGLASELDSLNRHPAARATVEIYLPEWQVTSGPLSGGQLERYAHGHTACLYTNPATGVDTLFRARSGSVASPQDGRLYFAIIPAANIANPASWEDHWVYSGIDGVMNPAWSTNSWLQHGGSLASAWTGSKFRVFYVGNYELRYADFNLAGGVDSFAKITGASFIPALGTSSISLSSIQLASCTSGEVYLLRTELIEPGEADWHKPVYGSKIHRYVQSGGNWSDVSPFTLHTHAEAALARDGQFIYGPAGSEWGNASAGLVTAQWGKRPNGGLGVNEIDSNTVVLSCGMVFYKRFGYDTHSQGVMTFILHRDSGLWERGVEIDVSDYVAERLDYAMFVRGSTIKEIVGGVEVARHNFLVWSRMCEPSDYDQRNASLSIPRTREVVYAKFSPDGKALTQYQYLGPQDDLTSAALLVANNDSSRQGYAVGWRAVSVSATATLMSSTNTPTDLELLVSGFKTQVSNRSTMSVDLDVEDATLALATDSPLKTGRLVKVYAGNQTDQVQIAQGWIDTITPSLSLDQEQHRAKVVARADKGLLDFRSEEMTEILPQNTVYITPDDPIVHIGNHQGYWETVKIEWPGQFSASGIYAPWDRLHGQNAYRLKSFPYANTGGDQGAGYPGMCLDQRPQHKGTWWNDAAWGDMTPMVDGSIEASVRFGDTRNAGDFNFWDRDKKRQYATVIRTNGIITAIEWRHDGSLWNTVKQGAVMAGLICHAAEMNKKFALVWEADTTANANYSAVDKVPVSWHGQPKPFSASSHTDDTWKEETFDRCDFRGFPLGQNRLYMVMSDYDDTDPDWLKNGKWIHKVVAGGIYAHEITPGWPADLKMMVIGGTIHCFYRPTRRNGQSPSQWLYAFSYKAGRFGAGRFGIIGRGHAGIQYDDFYYAYARKDPLPTGRPLIPKYDNYVDFWDIKMSDAVMDRPLEEILRRRCWQGYTPTKFNSLINEVAPFGVSGYRYYTPAVENLTIDFKVSIPVGAEAGVICRAVNQTTPWIQQHARLGLRAGGGLPPSAGAVNAYAVKRAFDNDGYEIVTSREYSPAPVTLPANTFLPVRVTVRGNIYSIWVAGNYVGHFRDLAEGGVYFGLYSIDGTATFKEVYVPELYEVLECSSLEINQTVSDALRNAISQRAIKGVFQPDGSLKFSYFEDHDTGPTFIDQLTQSAPRISDRFASVVRVDGAYTWAIYPSEALMRAWGRRFQQISMPDIFHREFCYKEAKNICKRLAEERVQHNLTGPFDVRVQPEDKILVTISQQATSGEHLVDDVAITFRMDSDPPQADMAISARQTVVL